MTFINTIAADDAEGEVKTMYQQLQGKLDYLPNYASVFCYRPQLMGAWSQLQKTIQHTIEHRRYVLVTLAAAQSINSSYCSLAHGRVLSRKYYNDQQTTAIAANAADSPLDAADQAMMAFARKVASDSSSTTQKDVDGLREHGFSDAEIFDIAATAAARCFFAKISDALGVQPDNTFQAMASSLKQQLVVGRAIENQQDG